ncbi:MAG TPA: hypothetical protein DD405_00805 [Desulfobacteraceae bacterium]|nr:hypothetical protein [Desulfobacteraceae bacterium]
MNITNTKYWEILREIKRASFAGIYERKIAIPNGLKNAYKITEALNIIKQRWPESYLTKDDPDRPVFIFSAGWRSGSALMQRLVISSGELAVWGEPLGEAAIIPKLAHALSFINLKWPSDSYFNNNRQLNSMTNQWIANLTPPISYLKASHRALIQAWLKTPAKEQYGVARWGFKEVRCTIDHARYLKWLFPNARFIFVYRSLFDAYKSWKGNKWYSAWPGYYSYSPIVFARHWRLLLEGFLNSYKEVDGIIVKFEDLVSGKMNLDQIADHIGVKKLDALILEQKIGSPRHIKKIRPNRLTRLDRFILSSIGGTILTKAGYCKTLKSSK